MLVRGVEEAPYLRLRAQQIEIIAGDFIAGDIYHHVTPSQSRKRICVNPGHPAEGGVTLSKILKGGIRGSQQPSTHPRLVANLIQVLWVAHIQRVQQDGIAQAKDDDIGANPQHQSDQGYGGEGGRLAKQAKRITNIQQQVLHEWQALLGMRMPRFYWESNRKV